MEARPKKQTVARSGFAPFSRSVAFGLEKHLLVGYGVTGKRPVYSTSSQRGWRGSKSEIYFARIFMRPVSFGSRQVYCFHRFHCQFFFFFNISLCQNTNCVCLLSLGGLLRNLSPLGMHVLTGINCTTKSLLISDYLWWVRNRIFAMQIYMLLPIASETFF